MNKEIGQRIAGDIAKMARFGHRWMGSRGEIETRGFIIQALEEAGLEVICQDFEYLSFSHYSAAFTVAGRELSCEPLAYSAVTDNAITAPLLYVGGGTSEDYARLAGEGRNITGSIVLSDNLRSFAAYPEAEAAGALGFVLVTTLPGNTIRCGSVRFDRRPGTIPALSIGGDDGREIIAALRKADSMRVTLSVGGLFQMKTGTNVIGRTRSWGTDTPSVLVSAHYDSFWNGVHAMDNLAGVATVMELARTLPATVDTPLEFILFAGEELGSWGAAGYVGRPEFDPARVKALINLDAFGSRSSELELGVTKNLTGLCRKAAQETGVTVDSWSTPPREASDHTAFLPYGVPSVWIANNGADEAYHTPLDCVEQISEQKLTEAFLLAARIVHLVNEPGAVAPWEKGLTSQGAT